MKTLNKTDIEQVSGGALIPLSNTQLSNIWAPSYDYGFNSYVSPLNWYTPYSYTPSFNW